MKVQMPPVEWILAVRPVSPRWVCPLDKAATVGKEDSGRDTAVHARATKITDSPLRALLLDMLWGLPASSLGSVRSLQSAPQALLPQVRKRLNVTAMHQEMQRRGAPCLSGLSIQVSRGNL